MRPDQKNDVVKFAKSIGYKESAYDKGKYIKDGDSMTTSPGSVKVGTSTYNNTEANKSKEWNKR